MTNTYAANRAAELKALISKVQSELTTCDDERAEQLQPIHDSLVHEYRAMIAYVATSNR